MKLTPRQRNQVIELYLQGESKSNLAKKFNVSVTAISKILNNEKVKESLEKVELNQKLTMLAFIDR